MIRFGVFGAGQIAPKMVKAIKQVEQTEVIAIAARSLDRAQKFAREHDIKTAYGSYEELCKNNKVDAVYIATTNQLHYEQILLCIQHGKHVLCEKPMTMTPDQAREVFRQAEKAGVFVMEALWSKYLPVINCAKSLVQSGMIGKVKLVTSKFAFERKFSNASRLFNSKLGGGALYDLGVYNVSVTSYILGEHPAQLAIHANLTSDSVDTLDVVSMKYPSGVIADFICGFELQLENAMTIYGEKGRVILHPCFHAETSVSVELHDGTQKLFEFPCENGFVYEVQEMADCIHAGKLQSDVQTWSETRKLSEIINTLLEKARKENESL